MYTVTICTQPSCDCPDALKGSLCKHMLFVLMKVSLRQDPLSHFHGTHSLCHPYSHSTNFCLSCSFPLSHSRFSRLFTSVISCQLSSAQQLTAGSACRCSIPAAVPGLAGAGRARCHLCCGTCGPGRGPGPRRCTWPCCSVSLPTPFFHAKLFSHKRHKFHVDVSEP